MCIPSSFPIHQAIPMMQGKSQPLHLVFDNALTHFSNSNDDGSTSSSSCFSSPRSNRSKRCRTRRQQKQQEEQPQSEKILRLNPSRWESSSSPSLTKRGGGETFQPVAGVSRWQSSPRDDAPKSPQKAPRKQITLLDSLQKAASCSNINRDSPPTPRSRRSSSLRQLDQQVSKLLTPQLDLDDSTDDESNF